MSETAENDGETDNTEVLKAKEVQGESGFAVDELVVAVRSEFPPTLVDINPGKLAAEAGALDGFLSFGS